MRNGDSIIDLIKDLNHQARRFIREEIQLARVEISEKVAGLGKDAASIAVGGALAYAGLIVFLAGLGVLLAWAFEKLGLNPALAGFLGLAVIGLLVMAVGGTMALAGVSALKKQSLAPQKTIRTLRELKGDGPSPQPQFAETEVKDERTPEQLESSILGVEQEMAVTVKQLQDQVTMTSLKRKARSEVQRHPYRWSLVAAASGMATSFILRRKSS